MSSSITQLAKRLARHVVQDYRFNWIYESTCPDAVLPLPDGVDFARLDDAGLLHIAATNDLQFRKALGYDRLGAEGYMLAHDAYRSAWHISLISRAMRISRFGRFAPMRSRSSTSLPIKRRKAAAMPQSSFPTRHRRCCLRISRGQSRSFGGTTGRRFARSSGPDGIVWVFRWN